MPLPDVSAVNVSYFDADGAAQSVDTDLFEVVDISGHTFLRFKPDFTWPSLDPTRAEPVTISFTAGFGATAADVPPSLVQAVKLLAAHWFANREAVSAGAGMADVPLGVRALIAPYRMVGV